MADSLRDQLRALGLVKTPEERPRERPPQRPTAAPRESGAAGDAQGARARKPRPAEARAPREPREPDLAQAYAARAREERAERERIEHENQERAREKRERRAKLASLLDGKALNAADADVARHFTHGAKIRRIYVTADQLLVLNKGELGVVQKDGRYLLVTREVALATQAISPEAMVLLPDPDAPLEDDVPPDLIW
jgi:uncharacterized protein YaiL (DUF2058 family)